MSLIFSRKCEYAIQGVLYLARKPEGEMTSLRELADRLNIPYHYLGKIFQTLARKGLLSSLKGPSGGFTLGMPPQEITLFHVVEAIDGTDFANTCVFGFSGCSNTNPCSAHGEWSELREGVYQMLIRRNLAALAEEGARLRSSFDQSGNVFFCNRISDKLL